MAIEPRPGPREGPAPGPPRARSASASAARSDELARIAARSVLDRMKLALRLGRRAAAWRAR